MPTLAHVPQMLAAGWGSVGSARADVLECRRTSVAEHHFNYSRDDIKFCVLDDDVKPVSRPDTPRQVRCFIAALDELGRDPSVPLPARLSDLDALGLPSRLGYHLKQLAARGQYESDVVVVLLKLLGEDAFAAIAPVSRMLKRRLVRELASTRPDAMLCERVRGCVGRWLAANTAKQEAMTDE
jgi:hypothetical protein